MGETQAADQHSGRKWSRSPGQLAGERLLQGRAEKRGAYSLYSRSDTDKLTNRGGAKDTQEQRLNIRMLFYPRQGDLPRGGRVMRIIKNCQTRSQLCLNAAGCPKVT